MILLHAVNEVPSNVFIRLLCQLHLRSNHIFGMFAGTCFYCVFSSLKQVWDMMSRRAFKSRHWTVMIYLGTYLLNSLGAKYRQTTLSTDVWTLSLLHYMSGETTQGAARSGLWSSTTDRDDAAPQHQAFKRLYCFCFQWWCMMFVFDLLEYIPSFGDIQAELLS